MSEEIKLFCWVKGDKLNHVLVKQSANVTELKSVIQAGKPSFKDIDSSTLELWKFELPLPNLDDESANRIKLEGPPLAPWCEFQTCGTNCLWATFGGKQHPNASLNMQSKFLIRGR